MEPREKGNQMDPKTMPERTSTGRLAGEIAIVTGGGQGIGRAIARRLMTEGAAVAILDVNCETGESTAAELKAAAARRSSSSAT